MTQVSIAQIFRRFDLIVMMLFLSVCWIFWL
jgi:hypothetical protein